MIQIDGIWNARMSGTNTGLAFVELQQQEKSLSGVARINDPMHGVSVYNCSGLFDGKTIMMILTPDVQAIKKQVTQIMVNRMPVIIETPTVQHGTVRVEGELREDNTVSGKWTSSIGTAGTFYMWRETIPECKTTQISKAEEENQAFVMMPIDPENRELEDILSAINRATKQLGIHCVRADQIEHSGKITDLILDKIKKSRYLICDISTTAQSFL